MTVHIVEPNPNWADAFRMVAARLAETLGALAMRIDHVGSTAVPGLAAKDVIDVQVAVRDDEALDQVADALARAGWSPHSAIARDHGVVCTTDDPQQWVKRFFTEPTGSRRINVHIRILGHANTHYALLFCDFLRAHPAIAAAYGGFKRRASTMIDQADDYPDLKDPVCDVIYLHAMDWAGRTGWTPPPSIR
jgi:dephospho-CoA kinase